jgi:transposase
MSLPAFGIDVSKSTLDVCLLHPEGRKRAKRFENSPTGFARLASWLEAQGVSQVHACMEATGTWWEALAESLCGAGHVVSVVNPFQIKSHARSELRRTKTDRVDALVIANYCAQKDPPPWSPMPPEVRELQALRRRVDSLQHMRQMERNRLTSGVVNADVRDSLAASLDFFDREIKRIKRLIRKHINRHPHLKEQRDLLVSIPGIGDQTAAAILAEFREVRSFASARQLAAFAGLTPQQRQSGSSIHGKAHLSKIGSPRLRKALFMPAIVALQHNVVIQAFAQRLRERGKPGRVILGAVMRKLIHLAYGVLTSAQPFDPRLAGIAS